MMTQGASGRASGSGADGGGYAPPGYRLRVAEWGVWLEGTGAEDGRLRGVLSDIPGFVHATGDSVASLQAAAAQAGKQAEAGGVHNCYEAGDSPDGEYAFVCEVERCVSTWAALVRVSDSGLLFGASGHADHRAGGARSGDAGSTRPSTSLGLRLVV